MVRESVLGEYVQSIKGLPYGVKDIGYDRYVLGQHIIDHYVDGKDRGEEQLVKGSLLDTIQGSAGFVAGMEKNNKVDRRVMLKAGFAGLMLASVPPFFKKGFADDVLDRYREYRTMRKDVGFDLVTRYMNNFEQHPTRDGIMQSVTGWKSNFVYNTTVQRFDRFSNDVAGSGSGEFKDTIAARTPRFIPDAVNGFFYETVFFSRVSSGGIGIQKTGFINANNEKHGARISIDNNEVHISDSDEADNIFETGTAFPEDEWVVNRILVLPSRDGVETDLGWYIMRNIDETFLVRSTFWRPTRDILGSRVFVGLFNNWGADNRSLFADRLMIREGMVTD